MVKWYLTIFAKNDYFLFFLTCSYFSVLESNIKDDISPIILNIPHVSMKLKKNFQNKTTTKKINNMSYNPVTYKSDF